MDPRVICLGELLIDLVSHELDVGLAGAGSFVKAAGGAPANVAAGLARLGVPVAFCGCVGDDPFGDHCAAVLAAEGVDLRGLRRSAEARTTLAFIASRTDGRKEIAFWRHPGADTRLSPAMVDEAMLTAAEWLHVGSVSLACEPARSATLRAVEVARSHGVRVSFDPNWRPDLWPEPAEAVPLIRRVIAQADLVKVAAEELAVVCGTEDADAGLDDLLAAGVKLAVITAGADGAVGALASCRVRQPALSVVAVDPLGAGDAFVAALLAAVLESGAPVDAADAIMLAGWLRRACAAGALACRRVGAIPALPSAGELDELLGRPAS